MDPKLIALVRAAESDERCPPVRVVTSSSMLLGTPVASREFADALKEPISEELWRPLERRLQRKEAEVRFDELLQAMRPAWNAVAQASSSAEMPNTLTLRDAQVWPLSGGDGVALPAVRVAISAVDAWWFGGGRRLNAPRESAWWLGITVPLD